MDVAPVTAFETGTNEWRSLNSWPSGGKGTALYLSGRMKLSWSAPMPDERRLDAPRGEADPRIGYDEYISDPAKPVTNRIRPVPPSGYDSCAQWPCWLVDDQRDFSGRQDVLAYTTDVLKEPLKVSGQPIVNLIASTSGTDSDWVVKVIDVYPDETAPDPKLGGYQLAVSMDIFRGRYRESFENPKPITPNEPLLYKWALPNMNHVFLPGHRIMIQIQSSWFPLYDRNPQKFVPNIFWAKPEDFQKATQRIYHTTGKESGVVLPLVTPR